MNTGKLIGVGVGPGDPELMTIKACRAIEGADVIVLPALSKENCFAFRIAEQVVEGIESKTCLCLDFPMMKSSGKLDQKLYENYLEIRKWLGAGKTVAFLTIGDPMVYSTYMKIHALAAEEGYETEVISGVTSFCAAASRLGISLGDRDQPIHILPGIYQEADQRLCGTRVYMKYGRNLAQLKEALDGEIHDQKLEVYAVENCGLDTERIYRGLENIPDQTGYFTIVIVQ